MLIVCVTWYLLVSAGASSNLSLSALIGNFLFLQEQFKGIIIIIIMVAHALTKSLPSPAHIKHRKIMLGHVPFSFAARSLRRTVGGKSFSLSYSCLISH